MALVSVACTLVIGLVLQMLQFAHVLNVVIVHGVLHPLCLEGATSSGGLLNLLSHVKVGARIAGRCLRGKQWIGREVWRFLLLGTQLVDDTSTLWVYVLWSSLSLRCSGSGQRWLLSLRLLGLLRLSLLLWLLKYLFHMLILGMLYLRWSLWLHLLGH